MQEVYSSSLDRAIYRNHKKLIRRTIHKYRASLILILCVVGIGYYRVPLLEWFSLFWDRETLQAYLQGLGFWGPAMLSLLVLVQTFIAIIPGFLLPAVSGYLYGGSLTILIIATSGIVGSQIAFWLARKYGRPLIYNLASQKTIEKWDRIAGNRGAPFYFFMFVLPFVPSDLMCYVGGLGKISGRRFFLANFFGRLWSTTEVALLGAYGFQPPIWLWVVLALSLLGLYIGWRIYERNSQPAAEKM